MASGRRNRQSKSSSQSKLLQGFVGIIGLYVIGIFTWQNSQLNSDGMATNIASIISTTKDAFIGSSSSISGYSSSIEDGSVDGSSSDKGGAIIPIDLTVNFLQAIQRAPGAPPHPPSPPSSAKARSPEDFLPVVVPSEITFRWAHRTRGGSVVEHSRDIKSYRIIVRTSATTNGKGKVIMWDSGKVNISQQQNNNQGLPNSVNYGAKTPPQIGQILEWNVQIWDATNTASSSSWSKFAVGPQNEQDWQGKWIVHPSDMDTFDTTKRNVRLQCENWKLRRPLPLFRVVIPSREVGMTASSNGSNVGVAVEGSDDVVEQIQSALLVISGLGSFRASIDGVPLSTSGPIDPPFTDYSKRVMYRGFDVTPFFVPDHDDGTMMTQNHVIGVTMGSGWWDHRPVSGMAKPNLLPRGPATVIAQVIITYASGKTRVVGQTGGGEGMSQWQVSRGHIRESDLFTGEMVDLGVLSDMEGWDTTTGWRSNIVTATTMDDRFDPSREINKWMRAVAYRTEVTFDERKQEIALKAKAMERSEMVAFPKRNHYAAPIGKLVPNEIPPVMPMERIAPDEIHDLGNGRWLLDYGKAFSGMLHFDEGVPPPIVPKTYPRAHGFKMASVKGDSFMTVIYGESLEMTTGDINRVLTAGLGLHDGGPRHMSEEEGATRHSYCFPDDHDNILSQRDVYVVSKSSSAVENGAEAFARARQSHFTTHSFRFAEVCCSAEPPKNAHALLYRTAVPQWGTFDSSNVLINGGYELVKNSLASNMLSVQSDCPHREKLPYGGDLIANSPAAMHMFDMSAFYKKTVRDWMDAQWDNGAYTETSVWQDLNDYAGIGRGAGETVWATAPPVLTVRHYQHYGDIEFLDDSLGSHVKWVDFLDQYFDAGMLIKEYDVELDNYTGEKSGLGDWLALRSCDTYLTHTAFYMAAGRCIAYIARKVGKKDVEEKGMAVAKKIQERIAHLYLKNGEDTFDFPRGDASHTPGPEMSIFSRIVPGEKRCVVLKNWFSRSGEKWPGDEEKRFVNALTKQDVDFLAKNGELTKRGRGWMMGWSQWQGFNEGIFAIRYALKTLSDNGFHHIALRKASGTGMATVEYMMRHNATTLWESWWRSEDLYSRNHPMLGAMAEWMSSSVAGVSHDATTTGARRMLFWPRFPKSATTLQYASATQGTVRGDYSIAWKFEDLPEDKTQYNSATVRVRIRFVIPPGGEGILRLPIATSSNTTAALRQAIVFPDMVKAKSSTSRECIRRRKARLGFSYNWEYDRVSELWYKHENGKAIGTPCQSYLFHSTLKDTKWSDAIDMTLTFAERSDTPIAPGLYEVLLTNWSLEKEVEGTGRLGNLPEYYKSDDLGPYCKDSSTFEWDIDDGTHII